MSAQPACPYCGARLFPHEVGNDECGSCGGRLSGAADGAPPEREEPPRRAVELLIRVDLPPPEAFATVRQGVNVVRWGAGLGMIGVALTALGGFTQPIRGRTAGELAGGLFVFGLIFFLVSAPTVLVGVCLCCSAPRECGAAKWARYVIASLLIMGTLVLVLAAGVPFHFSQVGRSLPSWLDAAPGFAFLFSLGVGFFSLVCYFQLLAGLARFFGDGRLARAFGMYFFLLLVFSFLAVVGGCVAFAVTVGELSGLEGRIFLVMLCGVWLALAAALTGRLLVLLTRLHRLIPTPGEPGPRREFSPPPRLP